MPELELTAGMTGMNPMPGGGGFTMEHGTHSEPIGVLDPFKENVSPAERQSSVDWSNDKAMDGPAGEIGDSREEEKSEVQSDEDDVFKSGMERSDPGQSSALETGAGVSRLSNTTYGPADQKPYEV